MSSASPMLRFSSLCCSRGCMQHYLCPSACARGAGMVCGGSWMSLSAHGALEEPRWVLGAQLCCSH